MDFTEMKEVRLFDSLNSSDPDQSPEKDWLNHFRENGTCAAVHTLVQFLLDLIQGDVSITLPSDINTSDEYATFFDTESGNLRDYINFMEMPPLLNFFASIIRETDDLDTFFPQEWLNVTVDVLHSMSQKESLPTIQVFAGYCCSYVLEYLGKKCNELGINSQAAFVALCLRLCSAIFHVYEICLSSNSYSDLAKYFLGQFISETKKNSTLMCEENIPFYQLTVQAKSASMNVKIVTFMSSVLTSQRSTDDEKKFMLRIGSCMQNELSYHISQKKFLKVIRACLKLVVEMHKISDFGFTGFHYDHIYQNLFSHDIEIRRLTAQLFVNKSAVAIPPKRLLEDVIRYHFKYGTPTADNWQMLIDAFEQYDNFFEWVTLFQMLDTYSNGERDANACHVAVAICNVAKYQIKKWNSEQLDEMNVIENLKPLVKLLAHKFSKHSGIVHSKVFNSLLQIFDVVDVAYFMHIRLKTELSVMLKSLTETFNTSTDYMLVTRLCQVLRCIEVNDPQAINLNAIFNQICNYFTLVWENQQDELEICLYPTMRFLVLLQHIPDLYPINLEEIDKIFGTCRTAFNRIKSAGKTNLQAFVVETYALTFVHFKVMGRLYYGELMDQFADDICSFFEWLTLKLDLNHHVNGTFWEYMIFRSLCVLVTHKSQLALELDKTELINTMLDFLIKFIKTANDYQSKDYARTMILTLAETFTNGVPLPYELFIVLNEKVYFDEQFNKFIKALFPKNSGNPYLFYRTFATSIHRMAQRKNPNISVLVKRVMAIVDENIPAIVDQQYLYTNVMICVFRMIADFAQLNASNYGEVQNTIYSAIPYLIPLLEHVKENPELVNEIRMTIPIPRGPASLNAINTRDLKNFYLLTESSFIV